VSGVCAGFRALNHLIFLWIYRPFCIVLKKKNTSPAPVLDGKKKKHTPPHAPVSPAPLMKSENKRQVSLSNKSKILILKNKGNQVVHRVLHGTYIRRLLVIPGGMTDEDGGQPRLNEEKAPKYRAPASYLGTLLALVRIASKTRLMCREGTAGRFVVWRERLRQASSYITKIGPHQSLTMLRKFFGRRFGWPCLTLGACRSVRANRAPRHRKRPSTCGLCAGLLPVVQRSGGEKSRLL